MSLAALARQCLLRPCRCFQRSADRDARRDIDVVELLGIEAGGVLDDHDIFVEFGFGGSPRDLEAHRFIVTGGGGCEWGGALRACDRDGP
jgi:hypothetical protein